MAEKIVKHDFIELDYTGKLTTGLIFDTTSRKVAEEHNLHTEKHNYDPVIICVGEQQILAGIDAELVGKEIGGSYTINLKPEQAFGKRDVKKVKIIPGATFKEHKMQPQPGLQIDVDGQVGVVSRVSGGRVIVNFNHPLAGKEVIYDLHIKRKVEDVKEQVAAFLHNVLKLSKENIAVELKESTAEITLPIALPPPIIDLLEKKLTEITVLKRVTIVAKQTAKN